MREERTQIYSCKEYFIMRDNIDGGFLAYENNGIFITCVTSSDVGKVTLEEFKIQVEEKLSGGENHE